MTCTRAFARAVCFCWTANRACGKSALVGAGLIPLLQSRQSLLPVLVRDWRVDWEQGPLVEAFDSLYQGTLRQPSAKSSAGRISRTSRATRPALPPSWNCGFAPSGVRLGARHC